MTEEVKSPEQVLVDALKNMFAQVVDDRIQAFFSAEKIWKFVQNSRGFESFLDNQLERLVIEKVEEFASVTELEVERIVDNKIEELDMEDIVKEHSLSDRQIERMIEEGVSEASNEIADEVIETIISKLKGR